MRAPCSDGAAENLGWWSMQGARVPALRDVRTRRVLLMLILIWLVGIFDLVFTLLAVRIGGFHEGNPLARQFIESPGALTIFKFAALVMASIILLAFSRRRFTEIGCWFIALVYVGLAMLWVEHFRLIWTSP